MFHGPRSSSNSNQTNFSHHVLESSWAKQEDDPEQHKKTGSCKDCCIESYADGSNTLLVGHCRVPGHDGQDEGRDDAAEIDEVYTAADHCDGGEHKSKCC